MNHPPDNPPRDPFDERLDQLLRTQHAEPPPGFAARVLESLRAGDMQEDSGDAFDAELDELLAAQPAEPPRDFATHTLERAFREDTAGTGTPPAGDPGAGAARVRLRALAAGIAAVLAVVLGLALLIERSPAPDGTPRVPELSAASSSAATGRAAARTTGHLAVPEDPLAGALVGSEVEEIFLMEDALYEVARLEPEEWEALGEFVR